MSKSQKEAAKDLGVKLKGKVGQFFCRHKNKEWFEENDAIMPLQFRKSFLICKDCGKACDVHFGSDWEGLQ